MSVTHSRIHKPMPLSGRRTSWPPDTIGDQFSPNCLNVRFRFGEVRATPGRGLLTGPVGDTNPTYIGQFPLIDGQVWAIMLAENGLWRWGDGSPGVPRQWHAVLGTVAPVGNGRWSVAVGEGRLFFVRPGDPIFTWDGLPASPFTPVTATSGTTPKARFVEYFNNRLVAGYTTEGSTTFANRIRWAENGNYLRWDSTLGLGAGFLDLSDERQEPIRGMRALGDRLVCFTRSTIKDVIGTGTLDPVHRFETRVRNIGCNSPYTLGSTGQQLIFMGYDRNIWAWDGIRVHNIGEPIFDELNAVTDPSKTDQYFAAVSTQRQEYWLILPSGDAFVYDYGRNYWTRDTVPGFTALGEVEDTTPAETWLTIQSFWNTELRTWEELKGVALTAFFGGRPDGSTALIDEMVSYDYFSIGSILDRFVETPDFYLGTPEVGGATGWRFGTIYRLFLIYEFVNDEPFEVGISLDRGKSWDTKTVIPNRSGFSYIDWVKTGNTARFRFREMNDVGAFRWRSYGYDFIDAGDFLGTS